MTQIIFNIDPKIKAKAMKRAKNKGYPFSAFLKRATEAFVEGRIDLEVGERIRPEKLKLWEKISRDYDAGKGLTFNSMKELRAHWKKL